MLGVSAAGSGLAEAYVMRNLHKEKMKRMAADDKEGQEQASKEIVAVDKRDSVKCSFLGSKNKIHSADSATKAS
ncbi:hypothetical protein HS088_TW12G00913 [Tripterygium wilfordii]|uniref:Uncharacterized protein n=1 Tax=Tripterygium wilfordii TaxID=458696 RepID=A0A7J7D045_TRIWF|nr:hypothetical protein HS088_TW12G00913 [Tripterygium wilfordii]